MRSTWLAVLFSLALIAHPLVSSARAAEKSDDWKGTTLDPKWHTTVMGDAKENPHAVRIENGKLRITAGGSDIWNDNDNGLFLWQWANGDFQAVGPSNTGSFFLPAGTYTVTAMSDGYNDGKPESIEIKAGQAVEIRAARGAKK